MAKAILIDATAQMVREVEASSLKDMQRHIDGYITLACRLPNGDMLFIDDDGMHAPGPTPVFVFAYRLDQLLYGNGLIVGREVDDDSPAGYHNADATTTVNLARDLVIAWGEDL